MERGIMMTEPLFPDFKLLNIADRTFFNRAFEEYQPETSELTFSNLFIWRNRYRLTWSVQDPWLLVLVNPDDEDPYMFPPVGPPSRLDICRRILEWMRDDMGVREPRIARADQRLVSEIESAAGLRIDPVRDHFDYLYKSERLIKLDGRKYHSKRNHINQMKNRHELEYSPISEDLVTDCLKLTKKWCDWRKCKENPKIRTECEAVHEALLGWKDLGLSGGAIRIGGAVSAFSVGEMLNDRTAVIHIEKADPDIPQLYSVINQQFCEHAWYGADFINREQDLGEPGLRKAKLSYYPEILVEKFEIRLA